jgi:hypothetical protein
MGNQLRYKPSRDRIHARPRVPDIGISNRGGIGQRRGSGKDRPYLCGKHSHSLENQVDEGKIELLQVISMIDPLFSSGRLRNQNILTLGGRYSDLHACSVCAIIFITSKAVTF